MPHEVRIHGPLGMAVHARSIMNGEYDVPLDLEKPTILDIGANIGIFTIWASHRWPNSTIHAYEPIKDNYRLLLRNLETTHPSCHVTPHRVAVLGSDTSKRRMRHVLHNPGECSFYSLGEQTSRFEKVPVMRACDLPPAEIVKIDTEGCEVEILKDMSLESVQAVMLEYHRIRDRDQIPSLLRGFRMFSHNQTWYDRGVMKFIQATGEEVCSSAPTAALH